MLRRSRRDAAERQVNKVTEIAGREDVRKSAMQVVADVRDLVEEVRGQQRRRSRRRLLGFLAAAGAAGAALMFWRRRESGQNVSVVDVERPTDISDADRTPSTMSAG